ncbi:GNAT family N-acetyltransferase [Desulfobulbus sp.]|uniref:GNAT family N-acetyltransferase n=1 Tax=Desulfobulbus sp. TaxID=895 RepID=UPI00286EE850|nr:GNAT family N-acetyltransferase [Desulfobulbus sp.]
MSIDITFDCSVVDFDLVRQILKRVGMGNYTEDIHRRAFLGSYATVFVWDKGALIGFGRAISDGVYQAAFYDIAVAPEYQRKGIGTVIINNLLDRLPHFNVILYASPGKENFYRFLQFRQMKTGMALFNNAAMMQEKGFTE